MDSTQIRLTPWTDRLAMDMALMLEKSGETLGEVTARHQLSTDDILRFNQDPVFLQKVQLLREDIKVNGLTFRMKARAQSEELLTTSWGLIHSPDVAASVKADLIKSTVKWADLEPKKADGMGGDSGAGVSITINMGGEAVQTKINEGTYDDATETLEHDG